MNIKKINPFSNEVYNFRKEIICDEEGADQSYLDVSYKYDKSIPEEVWKFSQQKWNSLALDSLHGVFFNGELAAISGSKLYGKDKNFLRTGMMYYILKRFRNVIRSPLWANNGLLETSVSEYPFIDYSFISIYPHNHKLKAWVEAFSRKERLGQLGDNSHISTLKSFQKFESEIQFNNVNQSIFYRLENINSNISIIDLINEIQDK